MRTYHIVEHKDRDGDSYHMAHRRGVFSVLGIFNNVNSMPRTHTYSGPGKCRERLHNILRGTRATVIETVQV